MLVKMKPGKGHVLFEAKVDSIYDDRVYFTITECQDRPSLKGWSHNLNKHCFEFIHETAAMKMFCD